MNITQKEAKIILEWLEIYLDERVDGEDTLELEAQELLKRLRDYAK